MPHVCRHWIASFTLTVILALTAMLLPSSVQAASYTVTITSTQFIPGTLTAAVGDTITFINNTTATQSAKTAVASGFNSGDIGPSKSKQVTLVNEGTFTYSSLYTPTLSGTITVSGSSSSLTDTTSSASTTLTSTVTQTQPQPVTGSTENLIILLVMGSGLMAAGALAHLRKGKAEPTLIAMPLVSSNQGHHVPETPPTHHRT